MSSPASSSSSSFSSSSSASLNEEGLCKYCAEIPRDPVLLNDLARAQELEDPERNPTWDLGTGHRVHASPCAFCRLVSLAYYEYQQSGSTDFNWPDDFDDMNLLVQWGAPSGVAGFEPAGPWDRGAFSLSLIYSTWICFAAPGRAVDDTVTSTAGCVLPFTAALLDIERVERWITTCDSSHGGKCSLALRQPQNAFGDVFPGLGVMRFVDVQQNRILESDRMQRYAALSYVWGSVNNFRLTRANSKLLTEETGRGIEQLWDYLPRTIRDAILLCRKLLVRYLWVDSLYLMQDDSDDVDRGVAVMDQIYERSWVTIVAACGHNADAGLPGVRHGTRMRAENNSYVKPGVSFGLVTALDQLTEQSVYGSRAWTFQESLLSRRGLYFVDNKVIFRCQVSEHAEYCVDSRLHITLPGASTLARTSCQDEVTDMRSLGSLVDILLRYSQRALSYESDVQRAMAGIIRRFEVAFGYEFLEGLPSAALDAFILFKASDSSHRRPLRRRKAFPTYSSAGWRGVVDCNHVGALELGASQRYTKWLTKNTWIVWHRKRGTGPARLVWDPDAHRDLLRSPGARDTTMSARALGDRQLPEQGRRVVYDGYLERDPFQSPIPLGTETLPTVPTYDPRTGNTGFVDYEMLHFWTVFAFFRLGDVDVIDATATLLGKEDAFCGRLFLDNFEESATFFSSLEPFKVILLSRTSYPLCMRGDWQIGRILGRYDCDSPTFYSVMLLERGTRYGAERRGIGSICQTALSQSLAPGPTWNEISLA